MRKTMIVCLTLGSLVLGTGTAGAQMSGGEEARFSGIKLVDMKARVPEQTVTLVAGRDALRIEPATGGEGRRLPYAGLSVTHTVSSAPPPSAGEPSAAATQPMSMPMYMGKTPRNWLTLSSGSDVVTLRVSQKVFERVRAALQERGVRVSGSD